MYPFQGYRQSRLLYVLRFSVVLCVAVVVAIIVAAVVVIIVVFAGCSPGQHLAVTCPRAAKSIMQHYFMSSQAIY